MAADGKMEAQEEVAGGAYWQNEVLASLVPDSFQTITSNQNALTGDASTHRNFLNE